MKKIIALMLSLLLCFGMLVACGPDEEDPSESSSELPSDLPSEKTDADNVVEFN